MKKLFILLATITLLVSCNKGDIISQTNFEEENNSNYIEIKYGEKVDIENKRFEEINTSKSSFIEGAWYDTETKEMILKLKNNYYQYCNIPLNLWSEFKEAESFGTYYNKNIKSNYSCNK